MEKCFGETNFENQERNFKTELHHYTHNLIQIASCFFRLKQKPEEFNKDYLSERISHHIEGIKSTFEGIEPEKRKILGEFCEIAEQIPDETDDDAINKYLKELTNKFEEVEEICKI